MIDPVKSVMDGIRSTAEVASRPEVWVDPVRTDPRAGGAVIRYACWTTIRTQTVAEHTWNLMRILHAIWDDVPATVLVCALHHDTAEVGTGDIVFPLKRDVPELKRIMDEQEQRVLDEMAIFLPPIDELWRSRIKICDLLEMWEFGMDERIAGNRLANPIITRTFDWARDLILRDPDARAICEYINDRAIRFNSIMSVPE